MNLAASRLSTAHNPPRGVDWDKSPTVAESPLRDREIKAAESGGGLSINFVLVSFGRNWRASPVSLESPEFEGRLCDRLNVISETLRRSRESSKPLSSEAKRITCKFWEIHGAKCFMRYAI